MKMGMEMDSNRLEVQKFLEEHFDLSRFAVNEFPLLPGGVILQDAGGSTLRIYWDILRQKVVVK
jgi:hypothetical protein